MNRLLKSAGLALFLAIGTFASAATPADLPNFSSVNDVIFRGGRPTAAGMSHLNDYGIKTDINLQGGDIAFTDPAVVAFMKWWEPGETPANIAIEKQEAEEIYHMTFVGAPLNSLKPVTDADDLLIDQILAVMGDKTALPVYVHCEHGWDRTGLIVALYRVKYEGKNADEAHAEWVANGHKGIGAYFTGYLDIYFYKKAAKIIGERASAVH